VHVIGGSGAAPHELSFAARHPDRVRAMTILVGAAPTTDDEYAEAIDLNRIAHRMVRSGDVAGLRALMEEQRETLLADPLGSFDAIMAKAPEPDREIMGQPAWQASFVVSIREALDQGVDGWLDEALVIDGDWADVDLAGVRTSVTWWHAASDANAPLSAAQRLVGKLPTATLRLFGDHEGHMAGYHREGEILDELLGRG
jgi:pimeloyl-ACP methyl ester carboxylesterase